MGHWYPIVSSDFHEHSMMGMMVLRKGYALGFGPFDAKKPFQERSRPRDCVAKKRMALELGSCMTTWKGVIG